MGFAYFMKNLSFISRNGLRRRLLLCWLGLILTQCQQLPPPRPVPPFESLLQAVAEFKRYEKSDLYHHPMPKDATGQNAFRATLMRLENYAHENPEQDRDIVLYTQAECLARLGEYASAVDHFMQVEAMPESPLAPKAESRRKIYMRIESALRKPVFASANLQAELQALQNIRARLGQLAKEWDGKWEHLLARRELEQAERETALFLFRNRYVMERGANRAIDLVTEMIEDHAESRLVYAHRLLLGEFYFTLAKDQALLNPPDRLGFDSELCYLLLEKAHAQFLIVARADGYFEKPEGIALIEAVEAFRQNLRQSLR